MSDAWDVFVLGLDKFALERERGPVKSPVNERFGTAKHRDMVADHFVVANRFRAAMVAADLAANPPVHVDPALLVEARPARKKVSARTARERRAKHIPANPTRREYEIAVASLANMHGQGIHKYVA